jgi:hypothetical protein
MAISLKLVESPGNTFRYVLSVNQIIASGRLF